MVTEIEEVKQKIDIVEQQIGIVERQIGFVERQINYGVVEQQIGFVERQINEGFVEQQINDVEERLLTAATEIDVDYLRKKEKLLRKEKDRLRKEKDRLWKENDRPLKERDRLRKEKDRLRKEKDLLRKEKLLLLKVATEEKLLLLKGDSSEGEPSSKQPKRSPGDMQIDREIGTLVKPHHSLSKFVACLKDPTLQESINSAESNSVIELPEGINWLGDEQNFSNQLFLRPCYFDLLEAKEENFKVNSELTTVVYRGTPGIGKSHLCALVVARKLIAGTVVFFESAFFSERKSEEKPVFRLHLAGGVHSVHRFNSPLVIDSVSQDANTVYIVDGGFPRFPNAEVEVQIFASPSKSIFRASKKGWGTYLYLYTPLFDLEELYSLSSAVSNFKNVSRENVKQWFLAAGGVARTVVKKASEGFRLQKWKAEALEIISKMATEDCERMILGLLEGTFAEGSDSLFHWQVDETFARRKGNSPEKKALRRFKMKALCFASDWVAHQIFLKLRLDKVLRVASLIMSTSTDVELSALRGYWFEALSHMILSSGGQFKCKWLDTKTEFLLTLPEAVPDTFISDKDASEKCRDDFSVYCVPMSKNHAAIDSLNSPYLFFQMASGSRHSINKDGVSHIMEAMLKGGRFTQQAENMVRGACDPPRPTSSVPVFVFCTTPSNFESHYRTPQSFVRGGKKTSKLTLQ